MLRLTALTVLLSGLVACYQAQSQEAPVVERAASQDLGADVVPIETQAKLSKYRNILEDIAKLELELASVVYVDQKDAEQSEPLLFQKRHRLEKLKAEAIATREQLEKLGVPIAKDSHEKNEAESKLWHDAIDKFNRLVKAEKWQEAEDLANKMANKFGFEDWIVQKMLWSSINGNRKSQGLSPLIKETNAPNSESAVIKLYSITDKMPRIDKEVPVFVEILIQSISAAIESSGMENSKAKIVFDADNQRLVVVGSNPQQQLVAAILKRLNKTTNAVAGKLEERSKAEAQLQSLLKLYPTADADKDGWLTQQEVRDHFPDADADGDGKVTPVEARNYLAKQKN